MSDGTRIPSVLFWILSTVSAAGIIAGSFGAPTFDGGLGAFVTLFVILLTLAEYVRFIRSDFVKTPNSTC